MSLFDDMNVFVVAVEAGSFSAAAKRLGLAKSVVSRRVSALEARLRGTLINRTTRGLSLTESGKAYYDRVRRILGEVAESDEFVRSLQGDLVGRLRVAAPVSFSQQHLVPVVTAFLAEHRDVEIDLDLDDREVDLVKGGFDFAVRIGASLGGSTAARLLGPCRRVVCASPAYIAAHGTLRTPDDLGASDHRFLVYGDEPPSDVWRFRVEGSWQAVRLSSRRLACNNGQAVRDAAVESLGLCMLPTYLASAPLLAGTLKAVLTPYALSEPSIYATWPPGALLSTKARMLLDVLERQFSPLPDWDVALSAGLKPE